MIRVCAVHGIGNNASSRASVAARWGSYLIEAGIDAVVETAEWDASGSPVRDLANIIARPEWVRSQAVDVARQIAQIRPSFIVAHSFGAVLATMSGVSLPVVAIGSPIGHAVYGRALSLRGMTHDVPPSYDIYNDEDDVACSRLLGRRETHQLGWMPVRVAVAGHGAFVAEHRDDLYLHHPLVQNILRYVARRSFLWKV